MLERTLRLTTEDAPTVMSYIGEMRSPLWLITATVLLFLLASCGGESGVDEQAVAVEPVPLPTSAEVMARTSELVFDSDSDISLGGSRLAPKGGGTWCLEDDQGVVVLRGSPRRALRTASFGIVASTRLPLLGAARIRFRSSTSRRKRLSRPA